MNSNPIRNAVFAELYIVAIASFIYHIPIFLGSSDDSVLAPIAMLSLFVLSAAIMGYLFLSLPILLYCDGKKDEAIKAFLKTVGYFSAITAVVFLSMVLVSFL